MMGEPPYTSFVWARRLHAQFHPDCCAAINLKSLRIYKTTTLRKLLILWSFAIGKEDPQNSWYGIRSHHGGQGRWWSRKNCPSLTYVHIPTTHERWKAKANTQSRSVTSTCMHPHMRTCKHTQINKHFKRSDMTTFIDISLYSKKRIKMKCIVMREDKF